jgi:KTSC domain
MPVRKKVDSSAIGSISWNAETMILTVHFTRGQTYQYFNVTQGEYDDFMAADSLGRYFNTVFKLAHGYAQR